MINNEINKKLENLIGARFKNIEDLKQEINNMFIDTNIQVDSIYKTTCNIEENDNLIDLVFTHDENEFFNIWYLYDNAKKIYITEV